MIAHNHDFHVFDMQIAKRIISSIHTINCPTKLVYYKREKLKSYAVLQFNYCHTDFTIILLHISKDVS